MSQILQIVGALGLLAGFLAVQRGAVHAASVPYLTVNAVSAADLAAIAFVGRDWGFLLLEGTWAAVSVAGLLGASRTETSPAPPQPATAGASEHHGLPPAGANPSRPADPRSLRRKSTPDTRRARRRASQWRQFLPPQRAARCAGDELSREGRLIRLMRDSYAGAQGRQWLQAHILWWNATFLRGRGVPVDWHTLTSPALARTIAALGLPPGHTDVHPGGQVAMNFELWWSIVVVDLVRVVYRPQWTRVWPWSRAGLPDAHQIEDRAQALGLRPWMSSATYEEISGIGRALTVIHHHDRRVHRDEDDIMVRVLLPELLTVELYWLHAPGGRPGAPHRPARDLVLQRQHRYAATKWNRGQYLTALDHLYLRAGDILEHLAGLPRETLPPILHRIVDLHDELRSAHDRDQPSMSSQARVDAHARDHNRDQQSEPSDTDP